MKPFDLRKAKAGAKLCTRDGRPARIICWDVKNDIFPLVSLIDERDLARHYEDGCCLSSEPTNNDLFLAPNINEGWVNVYRDKELHRTMGLRIYPTEDEAMKNKEDDSYIATTKIEWEE